MRCSSLQHVIQLLTLSLSILIFSFSSHAQDGSDAAKTIIVLDASGSMWGQIDEVAKIEIARDVISEIVSNASDDLHLGLIAYGHRREGDCSDIERIVEPGPVNAESFIQSVQSLNPKGKTPLSEAVKMAAEDLSYQSRSATVVLVSDGIETCTPDPCAFAENLAQSGVDLTVHVVGFGIAESDAPSLRCLSDKTGGDYFSASDADQLFASLNSAVENVVDYKCSDVDSLSGDWRYGRSEALPGVAEITQNGDQVQIIMRWTRSTLPGWHYEVSGEFSKRDCSIQGTWTYLPEDGVGGRLFAKVAPNGLSFETKDMPGTAASAHDWNGLFYYKQ